MKSLKRIFLSFVLMIFFYSNAFSSLLGNCWDGVISFQVCSDSQRWALHNQLRAWGCSGFIVQVIECPEVEEQV